jgi:hypothetical protein
LVAGVAAVLVAVAAGTARADTAAFTSDGTDPWAGGAAVTSQLETVAGAIATKIAGRPVTVRCEDDTDWTSLLGGYDLTPSQILGFVSFTGAQAADYAELSPSICASLQTFATATTKPTKCSLTRIVRRRRVALPPAPCFVNGRELTSNPTFWNAYFQTAEALQTLVHESIHLSGDPVESHAECYGMQWLAYAAAQLGDTPDDAHAIASYYATELYPSRQTDAPAYWSADCKAGGALDLTPNDGSWP